MLSKTSVCGKVVSLVLVCSVAHFVFAASSSAGTCSGHGSDPNHSLRAEDPITPVVTVDYQILVAARRPNLLGVREVGHILKFHVRAKDQDQDVCAPQNPVLAYLEGKGVGVDVYVVVGGEEKLVVNLPLDLDPGSPRNNPQWNKDWEIPKEVTPKGETDKIPALGSTLVFRFVGTIDDVQCDAPKHHPSADDKELDLAEPERRLAYAAQLLVADIDLRIYNEHGGPMLDEADEENPGSMVLVNDDDDDGRNGQDNANDVLDGGTDLLDMAKMGISVPLGDTTSGYTITLSASHSPNVRAFNERNSAVAFDETIDARRLRRGPIDYHVEGRGVGACVFTLVVKRGPMELAVDRVKVTVRQYAVLFNDWGAWPGGYKDRTLNVVERIRSTDLGLTGDVLWAIDHGGIPATIVSHTPATGTKWSEVVVRYDTPSPDASKTKAATVKAYDVGADTKLAAVRRTVFSLSSRFSERGQLEGKEYSTTYEFTRESGTDTRAKGINTPGDNGSLMYVAKTETVFEIAPSDIDWSARRVTFVRGLPAGAKWQLRLNREWRGAELGAEDPRLIHDSNWVVDGAGANVSDSVFPGESAQKACPADRIFSLDSPGWLPAGSQGFYRIDFRDFVEWHTDAGWSRCAPYQPWYVNLTQKLAGSDQKVVNNAGPGESRERVPNTRPTITTALTDKPQARAGDTVSLGAVAPAKDLDNDELRSEDFTWTQVSPSQPTVSFEPVSNSKKVQFKAPAVTRRTTFVFEVKVTDETNLLEYAPKFNSLNGWSTPVRVTVVVNP